MFFLSAGRSGLQPCLCHCPILRPFLPEVSFKNTLSHHMSQCFKVRPILSQLGFEHLWRFQIILRLSSSLWLGPSWLPSRPVLAVVRSDAILFESVDSYVSHSNARVGDVVLATSKAENSKGFWMVEVDCGAVEAHVVRPCLSAEMSISPTVAVLDLDAPVFVTAMRRQKRLQGQSLVQVACGSLVQKQVSWAGQGCRAGVVPSKLLTANGKGCVPWNSVLRPPLFANMPIAKAACKNRPLKHEEEFPSCRVSNSVPWLAVLLACWNSFWSLPLFQRNHLARTLLSTLPASALPRTLQAQSLVPFVPGWLCRPIENAATHHCWWFSHADVTQQPVWSAMRDAMQHNLPDAVFGPVTNAEHIQQLVTVLHRSYPSGLIILHQPASCCLLFLPSCAAKTLSFADAGRWLDVFPSTRAMIFTQAPGLRVGHFIGCQLQCAQSFPTGLPSLNPRQHVDFLPLEFGPLPVVSAGTSQPESIKQTVSLTLPFSIEDPLLPPAPQPQSRQCPVCVAFRLTECFCLRQDTVQMSQNSQTSVASTVLDSVTPLSSQDAQDVVLRLPDVLPEPGLNRAGVVASHLPFFPKWLRKSDAASSASNLPFFPKWLPKTAQNMTGGGLQEDNMANLLRSLDVTDLIARQAAQLHPDDVNAALDWACSSERPRVQFPVDEVVEILEDSPDSGHVHAMGAEGVSDGLDCLHASSSQALPAGLGQPDLIASQVASAGFETSFVMNSQPMLNAEAMLRDPRHSHAMGSVAAPAEPGPSNAMPPHALCRESTGAGAAAVSFDSPGAHVSPDADSGETELLPARVGSPCYIDDPAGEVHSWFCFLANSNGSAGLDVHFWGSMPLYSQYIQQHSFEEIIVKSLTYIQGLRGLDLSIEQAAKLPRCLAQTSLLPLAVAVEYLHQGCGFPAVFAFDLFQACLASCQHKALEVALYAAKSKSFTCKARWWACPTGDPNAGKSPTCAFVMKAFAAMVESLPRQLWPDQHWIGVGNNNRIQNRLRALQGSLLLYGPESKPMLDPNFPTRKSVDTGKFLDLSRWLESANGGRFEWGTGLEESERQNKRRKGNHATDPISEPLVFDPTNINLCLFQQFSLFEDWWCQVETVHKCGFSARVLMSPTGRAIVDRQIGLQDPSCVSDLMIKLWTDTATHHGPDTQPAEPLRPSSLAQEMVRSFYYDLHEEEQKGGWGSAMKAALGKMEYHVPTAACLTCLASWGLDPSLRTLVLSDNSIKCAMQHFALRLCQSCAIVDSTIQRVKQKGCNLPAPPSTGVRPMTARVLEICLKDPILESHMSSHFAALKGAEKSEDRISIMKQLSDLGLGELKESRRRNGGQTRCVEFHRFPLNAAISAVLLDLNVSELLWKPVSSQALPVLAAPCLPAMAGSGIFKRSCPCPFAFPWPLVLQLDAFEPVLCMRGGAKAQAKPKAKPKAKAVAVAKQCAKAKAAPKKVGRPPKLAKPSRSMQTPETILEEGFAGRTAFLTAQKEWAATLIPNCRISVRHQWYDFNAGYKVLLWCNSCGKCSVGQGGWSAWCVYTCATRALSRQYTPSSAHGSFDKVRKWNPLTAETEHALKSHMENHAQVRTQDLLKLVENRQPGQPVPEKFLQVWLGNHKVHRGPKLANRAWRVFDWQQLLRSLPVLPSFGGEAPDQLAVVSSNFDPDYTSVVLVNPALFVETWQRLSNQAYLKVCGDGTFRLMQDGWALLNLGVLTKHYASDGLAYAFRSTFSPLLFAIVNKEAKPTYKALFDGAKTCARACLDLDLAPRVAQYHCDWHPGENAARLECFPESQRVADFAHFMGACVRPRQPPAEDDTIRAYRAGFPETMKKHAVDQTWVPYLVSWVRVLRTCPSALLFHAIVERLLECMVEAQEHACADAFRQHYLTSVAAADFDVRGHDNVTLADWWCGVARLQPGSASGTQAQESWHRWKLKAHIKHLRQDVPTFVASLQSFTSSRLQQLKLQGPELPDTPVEPLPDKFVLYDSDALSKLGRSSAMQYYRTAAFEVFPDERGGLWYCLRKTLATYSKSSGKWTSTPDGDVRKPMIGLVQKLRALFLARDDASLFIPMRSSGCAADGQLDLEALRKLVSHHVLVLRGPLAEHFWRVQAPDGSAPAYRQVACFGCPTFSIHGSCEHVHVAWLHSGDINMDQAHMPQFGRKKPKHAPKLPSIVRPTKKRSRSQSAQVSQAPSAPSDGLKALLLELGFASLWPRFAKEQVNISVLSSWDLASMKAYFPDIHAGPATRILAACKRRARSSFAIAFPCQAGAVMLTGFDVHEACVFRGRVHHAR